MGKLFGRAATDWVHSFTIICSAQRHNRCVFAPGRQGLRNTSSKIGGRDKTYSQDAAVSGRVFDCHESAHAVTYENNARRIKPHYLRHSR